MQFNDLQKILEKPHITKLDFGQNYSLEHLILFKKITFQNSII